MLRCAVLGDPIAHSLSPALHRAGYAAIQAATNPTEGDWYYYVTVNLQTGETKFAETYEEFLTYKDELREYCATESEGAC